MFTCCFCGVEIIYDSSHELQAQVSDDPGVYDFFGILGAHCVYTAAKFCQKNRLAFG
jgi:hypothetical protein